MRGQHASRLGLAILLICSAAAQVPKDLDLRANRVVFSDSGASSLPDMGLLRDTTNNSIAVACIGNPPLSTLDRLALSDLQTRLAQLQQKGVLRVAGGHCSLTFPVLVGKQRRELQSVVDKAAERLASQVFSLAERLQGAISDRRDVVFHLLWSRVMDDSWEVAFKAVFKTDGPPDALWVIYPHQLFDVGTNYGNVDGYGSYALTWSDATRPLLRETSDSIIDAFRVAWNRDITPPDAARLQKFGLLSADAKPRIFTFHVDDPTDKLIARLRAQYAEMVATAYDYPAVARRFGLPPEQTFLILLHETAYAIFGRLVRAHRLDMPAILTGGGGPPDTARLLSLRLGRPPGAHDDAMYLFVKTDWRGNAQTADAFRHVIEVDPANLDAWLYLGFSLYEIKDYRGALSAFDQLSGRAGDNTRMRDWGHIWSGHMYDLLGEREQALALYRIAAVSDDKQTMMFGQYDIGPVTASDWAKQRLLTPFVRR